MYDVVVIGSGAAGIMACIAAAENKKRVLLLEKLPKLAQKLKATGGGKCNITNTLNAEDFMECFGRNGRFMSDALASFSNSDLIEFLTSIGVECTCLDGKRYFPLSKNSQSIIDALSLHMQELGVEIKLNQNVQNLTINFQNLYEIHTNENSFVSSNVIIATGGLGYQTLGTTGDGYKFAKEFGHSITELNPAMTPLKLKESWMSFCRADTIPKVVMKIDLPKYSKLKAVGDLIFTKEGIRGPVVLDFAREITPLLTKVEEVPLLVSFTGLNGEEILSHIKENTHLNIEQTISLLLPNALTNVLLAEVGVDKELYFKQIEGRKKEELLKILTWTPLHVNSHEGFEKAMITRGGVKLKEINPKTMQSKLQKGLYFCGEVVDIDGPCGGYNLQWAFSSGFLAGQLKS